MTIQFIESWKTYAATANIKRRWQFQLANGGTLDAAGCLMNGAPNSFCNTHILSLSHIRMGWWFTVRQRSPAVLNSSCLHLTMGGELNTSNQTGLGHNPDGTMSVFRGSNFSGLGGTTLANGSTVLSLNTAYWLELDIVFSKTATGSLELRINGVPEIVLSNIVTSLSSLPWINRVSLAAGNSARYVWGGMYIGDGADGWLGPCNVELLALTADTTQKDFTPSTGGTNYALVNDLDNATTYVTTAGPTATDLYTHAAPSYRSVSIPAVSLLAVPVAGTGLCAPVAGSPTTTPSMVGQFEARDILATAPDGGAWTYDKLVAAHVGVTARPPVTGLNFRATAGFIADSAGSTYVLNDLYPTTRGGVTFGWNIAGSGVVALDRTTAFTDVCAGLNCQQNTGTQRTFRVDLPHSGNYRIRLCVGDASFQQTRTYVQVKDGTTPLVTIDDSAGAKYLSTLGGTEWNVPYNITMTGTVLNITIGTPTSTADYSCITHLDWVSLDDVVPLTGSLQVAGVFAEALMSTSVAADPAQIVVTKATLPVVRSTTVGLSNGYLSAAASGILASALTYTVGTPPAHGTLKKSGSSTSSFTQADVDNGLITYTENGDVATSDSFVFTVSASGATTTGNLTFNITITAPVVTVPIALTANPLTTARNGTEVLFNGYLLATATAVADTAITYTVTTPPTYGTIYKAGSAVSAFTQADIDAGQVLYTQNGANVPFDQLLLTVSSSGLTSLTGQLLGIFIEDPGAYFSNATVQPCPTSTVCGECELSTVPADSETSTLGCCT